jgi:ATP-binding cassette, subfamily B, bacterial
MAKGGSIQGLLRQAQLIILDEPTSWMDARAEYEVFKAFRKIFQDHMVLLISHHFSTVRLADYINVLESGKIIEGGTHDDLIRRRGKYAQLFEIQASSYR